MEPVRYIRPPTLDVIFILFFVTPDFDRFWTRVFSIGRLMVAPLAVIVVVVVGDPWLALIDRRARELMVAANVKAVLFVFTQICRIKHCRAGYRSRRRLFFEGLAGWWHSLQRIGTVASNTRLRKKSEMPYSANLDQLQTNSTASTLCGVVYITPLLGALSSTNRLRNYPALTQQPGITNHKKVHWGYR